MDIAYYPFNTQISAVTSGAIKSYTNNSGLDLTLGSGVASQAPSWTSSGISGGAYVFDGSNDRIYTNPPDFSKNPVSMVVWAKPAANMAEYASIFASRDGGECRKRRGRHTNNCEA